MDNTFMCNSYLNAGLLNEQFLEAMKAQERHAIKEILRAKKLSIKSQRTALDTKLDTKQTKMKQFASQTIISNFKEGLTGKAAKAAEAQLKSSKFHPVFHNPIKG
ncbi:MAG: hypothetical protein LBS33_07660 [Streptococcaceae bacterium]|jgi:predicted glycosyl hydrolase (DUF1957 family)|nr:hypothetical protein [Streptococcaceae bacterium]